MSVEKEHAYSFRATPWKINCLEPANQPFRKEHDLNQTSMITFKLIFRGVCVGVWKGLSN